MANGKTHRTHRNKPTEAQKKKGTWVQNPKTGCWHKVTSKVSSGMAAILEDSVR